MKIDFGRHFLEMLQERGIELDWVHRCIDTPHSVEEPGDGTKHLITQIPEFGNRWLRVVINTRFNPPKGVTVFFDRRLRRKHESNR